MKNKIKGLFPPDFCDVITIFKRSGNGLYKPVYLRSCKFTRSKAEQTGILGQASYSFYARLPLDVCEVTPGDILVKGKVRGFWKKEENGEDILKMYPRAAFRVQTVSFCGNHIYVKG